MNHLKHQLKKHLNNILANAQTITLAKEHNIATNVYLEDWSNGMRNSPEYVFQFRLSCYTRSEYFTSI
jgi:D-citramalate synthase